jgi:hypothetical protein
MIPSRRPETALGRERQVLCWQGAHGEGSYCRWAECLDAPANNSPFAAIRAHAHMSLNHRPPLLIHTVGYGVRTACWNGRAMFRHTLPNNQL